MGMLLTFSMQNALSAAPACSACEIIESSFPSDPQHSNHPYIEQATVAAFEAMAALGHEGLLSSVCVPVLFATAHLDRPSASASSATAGKMPEHARSSPSEAGGSDQAAIVHAEGSDWRSRIALQALARIACACASLRQPILACLTDAISGAACMPSTALTSASQTTRPLCLIAGVRAKIIYAKNRESFEHVSRYLE